MRLSYALSVTLLVLGSSVAAAQDEEQPAAVYYYLLENVTRGEVERRFKDTTQRFAFTGSPNTDYRVLVLKVPDLRIGESTFSTPDQPVLGIRNAAVAFGGAPRVVAPVAALNAQPIFDEDDDGLSNLAERILGTDPTKKDTDDDGVEDLAEVLGNGNPTDGSLLRTGLVSAVGLQDTDGTSDMVAINDLVMVSTISPVSGGTRSSALQVFNAFNGLTPRLLARVDQGGSPLASNGTSALLRAGDLNIIDFSSFPSAGVARSLSFEELGGGGLRAIAVEGSVAYLLMNSRRISQYPNRLVVIDIDTGGVLGSLDLGTISAFDLAIRGDVLYGLTAHGVFTVDLRRAVGRLRVENVIEPPTLAAFYAGISIGRDTLYLNFQIGIDTFSLADPLNPTFAVRNQNGVPWTRFEVNGDRAVAINNFPPQILGNFPGRSQMTVWNLADDPTRVETLVTAFDNVDGTLALADGLAYVAKERLEVYSYLAPDTARVAPTVALSTNYSPLTAVEEGRRVRLTADASDDVSIRNVEFHVDDEKVFTDGTYPYEYAFQAPLRADQETIVVRVRASDTGGNATWSAPLTLSVEADLTAPTLVSVAPADGTEVGRVGIVSATFESSGAPEPIDPASVNAQTFTLTEAGPDGTLGTADDVAVPATYSTNPATSSALLVVEGGLSLGSYRADLTTGITDLAGNTLAAPQTWTFSVRFDDHGNDPQSAALLPLDTPTDGSLDDGSDEDWFAVGLDAGDAVQLTVSADAPVTMTLYDLDGETILASDPASLARGIPTSGFYFVALTATGTTNYQVIATLLPDDHGKNAQTATPIGVGTLVAGNLNPVGEDLDWFALPVTAGTFYEVVLVPADGVLTLFAPDGETQLGQGTTGRLTFVSPLSDTVYVRVGSDTAPLAYTITVNTLTDDHGGEITNATPLPIGGSVDGAIQAVGDRDLFRVDLTAGVRYQFGTSSATNLELLDATGAPVGQAMELVKQIGYLATTTGPHYVSVSGAAVSYTVSSALDDHADTTAGAVALVIDQPTAGQLELAGDEDAFTADLLAATPYTFACPGTNLDVFDPTGMPVASGTESVFVTATQQGAYTVVISDAANRILSYAVTFEEFTMAVDDHGDDAAGATALTEGAPTAGELGTPVDEDWFAAPVTSGVLYAFDVVLQTPGTVQLDLYESDGTTLITSRFLQGPGQFAAHTTPSAAPVYVRLSDPLTSPAAESYTVTFRPATDDHGNTQATATVIALGAPTRGYMETIGDQDWFSVPNAVAGRNYLVEVDSAGVDVWVRDASGTGLVFGQGSPVGPGVLAENVPGPLFIRVREPSDPYRLGTYQITVTEYVAPPDDHGDDPSMATPLPFQATLPGHLGEDDDDYFEVTVPATGTYEVFLSPLTHGSLNVEVNEALSGAQLVRGDANRGPELEFGVDDYTQPIRVIFQADAETTLVLRVSGSERAEYTLRVSTPEDLVGDSPGTRLPFFRNVMATLAIDSAGDEDWFQVFLPFQRHILMTSGSGVHTEVYDADLNLIGSGSSVSIPFQPGPIYVRVIDDGGGSGLKPYTIFYFTM